MRARALAVLVGFAVGCQAFYLPGVAPREYLRNESIDLKVNKLTSVKTQLPYGYYVLPYCQPPKIVDSVENLGEILAGDLIENSPYVIRMLQNVTCKVLCKERLYRDYVNKFKSMIEDEYLVNWMVDDLPAAVRYSSRGSVYLYMNGFPVGVVRGDQYYVHNHVSLELKYHSSVNDYEGYRIVGFEVEPHSIAHDEEEGWERSACKPGRALNVENSEIIVYTYDVRWSASPTRWASRWDVYLKISDWRIHWFSILNSLTILLFLSGMVATIIRREVTKYNELATAEEAAEEEEPGWKMVHGDVFRKPRYAKLLAVSVGSGVQILGTAAVTLGFALLGFLSPAHRGRLLQSVVLLFTFMGVLAGYTSARLYKVFNTNDWKMASLLTALLYPGIVFVTFFMLNLLIWDQKSSGAVPFTTMCTLLVLWFGISVPLVFLGSYFGFRKPPIELPFRANPVPRQIPVQPWFIRPTFTCLTGGVIAFVIVFTELFYVMSSLWQHEFYCLFGFLALVLVILTATCAGVSIASTCFQLRFENYEWWWRSFFASASSALYVFLYSNIYFLSRLSIEKPVSQVLYFGYMLIISIIFFLLTGSIGTIASFLFLKVIYGSLQVD